jgi:hypothetical protein
MRSDGEHVHVCHAAEYTAERSSNGSRAFSAVSRSATSPTTTMVQMGQTAQTG